MYSRSVDKSSNSRAIFLDRDGTINIDKGYLYKIEDFAYLPGAKEALKILQDEQFILIIVTNQSGIARGYYTEKDFEKLNRWMLEDLKKSGIFITDVLYCPHHPQALIGKYRKECKCRKPKIGLFMDAVKKYNIDVSNSYVIGDKPRDIALCHSTRNAPQGYLLYSDIEGEGNIHSVRGGLLEAVMDIMEKENGKMD